MGQYGSPVSDVAVGSWSEFAGNADGIAWNELDEGIASAPSDDSTTFWRSYNYNPAPASPQNLRMRIQSMGVPIVNSAAHIAYARIRKNNPGGMDEFAAELKVYVTSANGSLYQVAQHSLVLLPEEENWTTMSYGLTLAEINSLRGDNPQISYANIVTHVLPQVTGATPVDCVALDCSAMEFQTGNVAVGPSSGGYNIAMQEAIGLVGDEKLYRVGIDFSGNSFTWINSGGCVTKMNWTRKLARLRGRVSAGEAIINVENQDGRFNPDRSDGPWFGSLLPGLPLKIQVTQSGSIYPLFSGRTESFKVKPRLDQRQATITATDEFGRLREAMIDLPIRENYNVGSLFVEVLSFAQVSSFDVTTVADTTPMAAFSDIRGSRAMADLIEHGDSKAYAGPDGTVVVRNRYFDVQGAVTSSLDEFKSMTYTLDGEDVLNVVQIKSKPRLARSSVGTIAWIENSIPVPPGKGISWELDYRDTDDPNERTPANTVTLQTFQVRENSDGTGGDFTTAVSHSETVYAKSVVTSAFSVDSQTRYVSIDLFRGRAMKPLPEVNVHTEDSSSQAIYGKSDFTLENDLIGDYVFARDYAQVILEDNKGALAQVDLGIANVFPDIYELELGDLIHVTNSYTGIASAYTLTEMSHTVNVKRDLEHSVKYGVELYRDRNWLILDDAVKGRLDFNRLGF